MSFYNNASMNPAPSSSTDWRLTLTDETRKTNVGMLFKAFELLNVKTNQRFIMSKKWEEEAYNKATSKEEYNQVVSGRLAQLRHKAQQQQQQNQQTAIQQQVTQAQQAQQQVIQQVTQQQQQAAKQQTLQQPLLAQFPQQQQQQQQQQLPYSPQQQQQQRKANHPQFQQHLIQQILLQQQSQQTPQTQIRNPQHQQLFQMIQQNPQIQQKLLQSHPEFRKNHQLQRQSGAPANFVHPAVTQMSSSPRPQFSDEIMSLFNMNMNMKVHSIQQAQAAQAAQVQMNQQQQQIQQTPIINQPKTPQQTSQDLNRLAAFPNAINTGTINNNGMPMKINNKIQRAQNLGTTDMINKLSNQNFSLATATSPAAKANVPQSKNQTPQMAAAVVNKMAQGNGNSAGSKMSISPVIQQNQSPIQGVSTQVPQISTNTVNSPVVQNTGIMLQTNSSILPQVNTGINIQNAQNTARPSMITTAKANTLLQTNPMFSQYLNNNVITMIPNSTVSPIIMAPNATATNMFPSGGVNSLLAQPNAMLAQNNPLIAVARPNQMMATQASSIGMNNLVLQNFRTNSQGQHQPNTQANISIGQLSSSTPVTQPSLAVLNEKESQEARNQIASIDARAKERRIQYHEIHDLTEDEKNKIMEKLKELTPMYQEVDKVLPYFWHYTKSSQGTYRLLGMKYMIEDQLKALPDKFLLRLELVDSLLQQFRKYFVFVESRRRGISDNTVSFNNPGLPHQRTQPQAVDNIIPPRMGPSDLKLPLQKQHSRDNSTTGSSTNNNNKKRRQSTSDGEQPSKKSAPSKQSDEDVMIIEPPSKSNITVPQTNGSSVIVISDDIVKNEDQQQLQKINQVESNQQVVLNIPIPPIKSDDSAEGYRETGKSFVNRSKEIFKNLRPVKHGRYAIDGYKPAQNIPIYNLGGLYALCNTI